jgi:hypothetical protein
MLSRESQAWEKDTGQLSRRVGRDSFSSTSFRPAARFRPSGFSEAAIATLGLAEP